MPYQPGVTGEQPQGVAGKRPRRNAVRGTSTLVEGDDRRVGDLVEAAVWARRAERGAPAAGTVSPAQKAARLGVTRSEC